jgi:hypothetical protein
MIEAMEINERGLTPDTPTTRMPSPILAVGAQPLLVEAKRCEAKASPKKFNTQARMSVGGKGLQWCNERLAQAQRVVVIISSDEDEGEKRQDKKPPTPRRSLHLLGVKRKNYIEHTPEPKDYAGDSDWESIMSPGSWGATGRDYDDDWPGWPEEERREEDDSSRGNRGKKKKDDDEPEDNSPNRGSHHFGCCVKCRNEIVDLRATIDRCHDRIMAMDRRMDDIESLAERDYNFLLCNIRKLFGMVGDLQKLGGGRPRCNCPRCR